MIGKIYKCIGLTERTCGFWSKHFKIGELYERSKTDEFGTNLEVPKVVLLLYNDNKDSFYVDASQFEALEDEDK